MRAVLIIAIAATAALVAQTATAGDRTRPTGITSADARLQTGAHKTLLAQKGLGRWVASCSKQGVTVTFTADRLLPTSDLVIAGTQGAPRARTIQPSKTVSSATATVLSERWQIAPFAAAQVQVAVATVAARATHAGCAASVLVLTGPDQGATITRAPRGWHEVPLKATPKPALPPDAMQWTLPSGWQAVPEHLTSLGEPVHRLAAASFPLRQTHPDRDCSPDTARKEMPKDGALVFILESLETNARPNTLAKLPARPAHFTVRRVQNFECLGPGAVFHWTEHVRALQADVLLGPKAGTQRRAQVERLLDSLVVEPIGPPSAPIGWHVIRSHSYDSMRVPPGWTARALQHPHETPRPRALFRIANPQGTVVVNVTELRRGRAQAHDTLRIRGYRFRTRIEAQDGAAQGDIEQAQISAQSLGVSGVGRG